MCLLSRFPGFHNKRFLFNEYSKLNYRTQSPFKLPSIVTVRSFRLVFSNLGNLKICPVCLIQGQNEVFWKKEWRCFSVLFNRNLTFIFQAFIWIFRSVAARVANSFIGKVGTPPIHTHARTYAHSLFYSPSHGNSHAEGIVLHCFSFCLEVFVLVFLP